ncbi:MAG: hypothetical protein R3B60_05020 [Candidatus Paceibacterota bacterium]
MKEKLKSYLLNDQIFYGVLVILMAGLSFNLGQMSVKNTEDNQTNRVHFTEIKTENQPQTASAATANLETTPVAKVINESNINKTGVVASKNGTRYYLSTCSGAKRIKPENLITFPTVEAAKAAGYTKAMNCSGL